MKNIHKIEDKLYIINNEEIKEGVEQWYLDKFLNKPMNSGGAQYGEKQDLIILTDNKDLIKDGIQEISKDFLHWFIKNPSCESVDVKKVEHLTNKPYRVTIPKEEAKQDLEKDIFENLKEYYKNIPREKEPKQETKNNYSEQDMIAAIKYTLNNIFNGKLAGLNSEEIFKQFKKKKKWKIKN